MNDKDRDLIQTVLQAAGKAGEQGFAYLVHYQVIDGITSVLVSICVLAVVAVLFRRVLAWQPQQDEAHLGKALAFLVLGIIGIVFACCVQTSLTQIIAPEGAAIHSVFSHCH